MGQYTASSDSGLSPAGFPAPPSSATLCGSVVYASGSTTSGLLYFLNSGSDADLVTYYRTQLSAQGYTVTSGPAAPKPCDEVFLAHKPGVTPDLQIYIYGQQGAFSLGPFSKT